MTSTPIPHRTIRGISRRALLGCSLLIGGSLLAACSRNKTTPASQGLTAWPAKNRWPAQFWQVDEDTQQAYRFAVDNPRVLQYIPCYCGCYDAHTSLKDCFVQKVRFDGSVVLDPMGFG